MHDYDSEFIYAEKPSLTSFSPKPSLPPVFVVGKNRRRRPGAFYYVICGIDDVTGSKHKDMFILMSSATATKMRQVPAERPILPLEHIWV